MASIVSPRYVPAAPTYVYVDGAYIRRQIGKTKSDDYWFDPWRVATSLMPQIGNTTWGKPSLTRTFYYDAFPDSAPGHDALNALGNLEDLTVRQGHLVGNSPPRQKGVDVYLAVDALTAAQRGLFNVAVLVAGDADFVPLVNALTDAGPLVVLASFRASTSAKLVTAADRWIVLDDHASEWRDTWSLRV